jgi:putative phosphoribosyl transferase
MIFTDRTQAGQKLAVRLKKYANRKDVIVLATPRGGVPVAYEVASELKLPLDIFVLRKLGVPGHEELAFGAIASGGVRVLDRDIVVGYEIAPSDIERIVRSERQEMRRREDAYRGGRPPLDVKGKTVILVDDGIATGASILAGIRALRQLNPARIVVAVPVAPPSTCAQLKHETDELISLETPEQFFGVGQFYFDFSQVTDEQVVEYLARAWRENGEHSKVHAEIAAGGEHR